MRSQLELLLESLINKLSFCSTRCSTRWFTFGHSWTKNLTFVSIIFCFLDEKLKFLKIWRDLVEISPNLQEFKLFNEPSF